MYALLTYEVMARPMIWLLMLTNKYDILRHLVDCLSMNVSLNNMICIIIIRCYNDVCLDSHPGRLAMNGCVDCGAIFYLPTVLTKWPKIMGSCIAALSAIYGNVSSNF